MLIMKDCENYKKALMLIRITVLLLLSVVGACNAQESTVQDPVAGEQEMAKTNVWDKARLRGVSFRAIGQEPGWLLEIIKGKEIVLMMNYGQERRVFSYVEPREDKTARRTEFQIDAESSVLIEGKPCNDPMSGESFQSTVTVVIGEQALKGCGRALF